MAQYISTFPSLPLTAYCEVVWEARDPVTGAVVSGVKITNPVLYGVDLNPQPGGNGTTEKATPLWLPTPDTPEPESEEP